MTPSGAATRHRHNSLVSTAGFLRSEITDGAGSCAARDLHRASLMSAARWRADQFRPPSPRHLCFSVRSASGVPRQAFGRSKQDGERTPLLDGPSQQYGKVTLADDARCELARKAKAYGDA